MPGSMPRPDSDTFVATSHAAVNRVDGKKLRVIQWGAGNSGIHALRSILLHPELDLVALKVFSESKAGRDAGDIAGLPATGIVATQDIDRILAVEADCVVYMEADHTLEDPALADSPSASLVDQICRFLEAGLNVVATSPGALTYPPAVGGDVVERLERACRTGGASFLAVGMDPGFMGDQVSLLLSGLSQRITYVHAQEILNYAEYDEPGSLRAAGFGQPPRPDLEAEVRRAYTSNWGGMVKAVADRLNVTLDEIRFRFDHAVAHIAFDIPAIRIDEGMVAGHRFAVEGWVGGRPAIILEHIIRLHDDAAPGWPRLDSGGWGYRITIDGAPSTITEIRLGCRSGMATVDACLGTGARAANAIPSLCAAPTGVHSSFTLPMIVGRERFDTGPRA